MIDKKFYAIADSEISQGAVDQALWIKIKANNVGASGDLLKAKYLKLRARELAASETKGLGIRIWNVLPRWVRWTLWAFFVILCLLNSLGPDSDPDTAIASFLLIGALTITALYWIIVWVRRRV